jgi:hypothetical protein
METRQTTAQKIALSTLTPNGKWIKSLLNLCSNQYQEKSTTRCSELPTTNNIPPPILHFFRHRHTKTATPKLQLITNPITTPPLTIHNLPNLRK